MYYITRCSPFLVIAFFLSTLFSCSSTALTCGSSKDAFLDNYYQFVQDIRDQQKNGDISSSEWNSYDTEFNRYTQDCYKSYEMELNNSDKLGIASCTAFYLYAKHGMMVVTEIAKQEAAIKEILSAIDPMLMIKIAKEIFDDPKEIKNIVGDLEKRYGE